MAFKRFQNSVAESRFLLPLSALITAGACYLSGLVTDGLWMQLVCLALSVVLVVELNNTHLLRQTDAACVEKGHRLCEALCAATGRFIWCDCYPEGIVDGAALEGRYEYPMPLGLYMRPSWIDK